MDECCGCAGRIRGIKLKNGIHHLEGFRPDQLRGMYSLAAARCPFPP